MPSRVTWTTTLSNRNDPSADGRVQVWNNTVNLKSYAPDDKPVNGYSDQHYRSAQAVRVRSHRSLPGGSVVVDYNGNIYANGYVASLSDSYASTFLGVDDALKSSMLNTCIVKALVKIADAKVNLPVAFAEAAKTSDLILGTARRIHNAYQAFRRGNLKGIADNLGISPKKLHNSWLEYRYGWLPLLMDVKGAAEFFAQQHVVRPPRFVVNAKEKLVKGQSFSVDDVANGGTLIVPHKIFVSSDIEVHVKVWCELTSPHLSELQQLGMTNPALVLWELVPFSFVFDWFIQVGDYLTGLTALQGVTVRRKMWSLVSNNGFTQVQAPYVNVQSGIEYTSNGLSIAGSLRRYDRGVPDLSPISFYPPVTNSFNFTKLVTSLALIKANYRGDGGRLAR